MFHFAQHLTNSQRNIEVMRGLESFWDGNYATLLSYSSARRYESSKLNPINPKPAAKIRTVI